VFVFAVVQISAAAEVVEDQSVDLVFVVDRRVVGIVAEIALVEWADLPAEV